MTGPQAAQRSALKEARLLHKLGKRMRMPGAGLPRIIAALQQLQAEAAKTAALGLASDASRPPIALRPGMSLTELLGAVESILPVAGSISAWHKPQPAALTTPMQALRDA